MHSPSVVDGLVSITDGAPLGGAIIVATDGTHDSDGAVRVGVELGRQHAIAVRLISVVEASDFLEYEGTTPADLARATRIATESREGELAAQRQRTHLANETTSHTICVGCRVEEIVRFAEHQDAALIVMGVGSHGVLARLLHRHTVMRVAAATMIPILAVPADGLPSCDLRVWSVHR